MKLSNKLTNLKGGFTLIELMVVIAILAALAGVSYGPIMDRLNDGDRQVARDNLTQVHKMLTSFNTSNKQYPSDLTADKLEKKNAELDYGELKGNTSNAYFRQMMVSSKDASEKNFYAKINCAGYATTGEGDNKFSGGKALAQGENAMAYVMKKGKGDKEGEKLPVTKSGEPLAICGIYPSKTPYNGGSIAFDNNSFRGHAFVLYVDGSVKDIEDDLQEDSDDDDKAVLNEDVDIFPERRRGGSTADNYLILSPDL